MINRTGKKGRFGLRRRYRYGTAPKHNQLTLMIDEMSMFNNHKLDALLQKHTHLMKKPFMVSQSISGE